MTSFMLTGCPIEKVRRNDEIDLLRQADLVFATSHRLIEHCSQYHSQVSFFPFGVDLTHYNEYLVMGKRIVSTPIREILIFNQHYNNPVAVAHTAQEFAETIRNELGKKTTFCPKFVEIAKTNSWEQRIEAMLSLIDQKILEKEEAVEKNWSHRIKILYRAMTRKIAIASLLLILTYAIFFYSKVPYYIAQPLKAGTRESSTAQSHSS